MTASCASPHRRCPTSIRHATTIVSAWTAWIPAGSIPAPAASAISPRLAHGDYRLHVEAAGPGGAWTLLKPLLIHVSRPPWMTWWAWIAYVLLGHGHDRHGRAAGPSPHRAATPHADGRTRARPGRAGQRRQDEFPGDPGPRDPHAHDRRAGHVRAAAAFDAWSRASANTPRPSTVPARCCFAWSTRPWTWRASRPAGWSWTWLPFDPREAVRDVVQLQSGVAQGKGLALESQIAEDVPAAGPGRRPAGQADPAEPGQQRTEVHFEPGASGEPGVGARGLCFSVVDTGSGVPEESRGRLFQRYEQADSPQRRSGSGLGLAICRELSTLMGGYCELAGTGADGSTFRVWLPLRGGRGRSRGRRRQDEAADVAGTCCWSRTT